MRIFGCRPEHRQKQISCSRIIPGQVEILKRRSSDASNFTQTYTFLKGALEQRWIRIEIESHNRALYLRCMDAKFYLEPKSSNTCFVIECNL